MTKKETALAVSLNETQLAELRSLYPVEQGYDRVLLPRLGMISQDVMEGKGKSKKVVQAAGTFFIDRQDEEENAEGVKEWHKTELGDEIEGIILFQRKQLRFYDAATEKYTSSPVYDTDDQVIPLFCDKAEVAKGTPPELKAREEFQGVSAKGKPISKLEENRILYVLYEGELFQMNLRGTSMFSYIKYAKKTLPPSVLTRFNSESKENGGTEWNQMTFEPARPITKDEHSEVLEKINEIKEGVEQEKAYFAAKAPSAEQQEVDRKFNALGAPGAARERNKNF